MMNTRRFPDPIIGSAIGSRVARPRRSIAAVAAFALLASLSSAARGQQPPQPLVSVDWLSERIADPDIVVLHVGSGESFANEHIPNARHLALENLAAPRAADRTAPALEMPDPDAARAALEALGVSDGSRIVVYSADADITRATRVLFTLRNFGLGERAHLLDGGITAWKAAGKEVTSEATPPSTGTLSRLRSTGLVVDEAFVLGRRAAPGYKIVDARATAFYDGSRRGGSRAGHIDGAVSVPFSEITSADGRVKPRAELEAIFRAAGVEPGDTVIAYCHIGQQATAAMLGATLLGHSVLLYDGSYNQWSQRNDLPVRNPGGG